LSWIGGHYFNKFQHSATNSKFKWNHNIEKYFEQVKLRKDKNNSCVVERFIRSKVYQIQKILNTKIYSLF